MIEVMFGESEGATMQVAKNYRKPDFKRGPTAWFGRKPSKKEFDRIFEGEAVGGDSSEVVCLPFLLDIGDITTPVDGQYRKKLIRELYTIIEYGDENTEEDLEDAWNHNIKQIQRLKQYASKGEELRIWYSKAPYSICGFYHACSLLQEYDCRISVIELPRYSMLSDNELRGHSSWGEVAAGNFYQYLPLERILSGSEVKFFASEWEALKKGKSTLRAAVSGMVIGVPEDFYDHILRKEIPEGEFVMARLMGDILIKYSLGVGIYWYVKRILRMIELGELKVVQGHKEIIRQVLCAAAPVISE